MSATVDHQTQAEARPTILIVDDEPANLAVLTQILQAHYRVRAARSGEQALRIAASTPRPDLVLLDIMMPDMDGYTVLGELNKIPEAKDIPVLFVTALSDEGSEEHGLEIGAVDYITKPLKPAIVLARVRIHLELKAARDRLAEQNSLLETRVAERTQALKEALEKTEQAHASLKKTYFGTLMAVAALVELRGGRLGEHARRVADLSRQVAAKMGLSNPETQDIFVAALLHDIGKIGFPDGLLDTPVSTMNHEQLAYYRQHPGAGADALKKIESLAEIAAIVRHHHEYFNGSGFPDRLAGLSISIGSRIIGAVSDYDALKAGYQTGQPLSAKQSWSRILQGRGSRYDPKVVDMLEEVATFEGQFEVDEVPITAPHIREGMVLARDIIHPDGYLLLSKSTVMTRSLVDQLVEVQKHSNIDLTIYVNRERVEKSSSA